jgi:hypothetical protein
MAETEEGHLGQTRSISYHKPAHAEENPFRYYNFTTFAGLVIEKKEPLTGIGRNVLQY